MCQTWNVIISSAPGQWQSWQIGGGSNFGDIIFRGRSDMKSFAKPTNLTRELIKSGQQVTVRQRRGEAKLNSWNVFGTPRSHLYMTKSKSIKDILESMEEWKWDDTRSALVGVWWKWPKVEIKEEPCQSGGSCGTSLRIFKLNPWHGQRWARCKTGLVFSFVFVFVDGRNYRRRVAWALGKVKR